MADLETELFTCLSDNFGVLIHDPESGQTASIDAPEEAPILEALERRGWTLTHIFVTHHHHDHVGGIAALKSRFNAQVLGPAREAGKIAGLDTLVDDGDTFDFGGRAIKVISTPGHTLGHVCYYIPSDGLLFAADTLFALGCGRVFEGTMADMWNSLNKLAALPDETLVYFGHEYTQSNARYAVTVEPDNEALIARAKEIDLKRAQGMFTAPTTIGLEKQTNPFLRASTDEQFAEIRTGKDNFR